MHDRDDQRDQHDQHDQGEQSAARARAATALRRFGHALHSREADMAMLERVADAADAVTEQLLDMPPRTRDLAALVGTMWRDPVPDGAIMEHFDDCFVSGAWNPLGIGIEVRRDGDEAVATVTLGPAYEGAPQRSHGGIVAAIFDDVLGCLLRFLQQPAYTGELTVRYLAPTPIGVPLEFRARVEQIDGRKIDTIAEAYAIEGGERTHVATGTARFIAIESYTP